ncbi:hypothetical protein COO60DRAFT_644965 [Scenedesmus sp. NREL 46B-D3]|nr:hypothetical protein COO60DRAFT_644965 [Scenedesmus sp. NREL 46B-D3]
MLSCRKSLQGTCCKECNRIISFCGMRQGSATNRRTLAVRTAAAADKQYAVVGAGLAGLATAYHLLKQSSPGNAVHVTVVDAVGIGAGGSGAAAGLLHPFSPKGKLLWKAHEAMASALQLLEAAEEAAAQSPGGRRCSI